jgi:NAD(P)-dependent dehydrogenase (short-subunit alcohol dehydrogenase family)
MKKLEDKVAVITGGNSGIGLATAKLFHEEGAKVVLTGRRKEVVESAAKEVGANAIGIVNDTSDLKDIDSLYEQVDEQHGKIDVLFLNAGIATFEPFEHTTEESFDRQFNTNVKGLYFNIQKALPLMKNGGAIVLTTSIANQIGMPNTSAYSASKAAVRSFARTLSAELIEKGIRVNCVSPGPIETPIFTKMGIPPEAVNDTKLQIASGVPMKRMGIANEVAKAALYLASSDSSFTTGIDLTVDGGMASL